MKQITIVFDVDDRELTKDMQIWDPLQDCYIYWDAYIERALARIVEAPVYNFSAKMTRFKKSKNKKINSKTLSEAVWPRK